MALPIIDISPFIHNVNSDAKKECANKVYKACTDTGFFLISYYQDLVPQQMIDSLFGLAHQFFALSAEEKAKLKGKENRGYVAIGDENLSTVYTKLNEEFVNKDLGDFKEGFDLGREVGSDEDGLPFRCKNTWPESLGTEWRAHIENYFEHMTKLGHVLTRIFATALGLDELWFEDKLDKPMTVLRLLHYPPLPAEPRFGCGAHSDYGCCAILAQDNAGGLQLLNSKEEWINIPCVPATLVVNIGDMMQRWTNDLFKSTVHRVINPTGKHRFSVPFFFEPNFDAVVECLDTCKGESGPKYPPIKFGDHLTNMYSATFETQQNGAKK